MEFNRFSQALVNEQDIFQGLYSGKFSELDKLNIADSTLIAQFNRAKAENADPIPNLEEFLEPSVDLDAFDRQNQNDWFMPEEYKNFPIAEWLLEQCHTEEQKNRVLVELELFIQHNMIEVLKYLKYLVDTLRQNNIVWGVGRGSSVASYCLYLIGIHKIDSIKYQLDIHEFLR